MWHGDSDKPAGVIIIVVAVITIIIIGSSYNSAFRNHVRPSGSLIHATVRRTTRSNLTVGFNSIGYPHKAKRSYVHWDTNNFCGIYRTGTLPNHEQLARH